MWPINISNTAVINQNPGKLTTDILTIEYQDVVTTTFHEMVFGFRNGPLIFRNNTLIDRTGDLIEAEEIYCFLPNIDAVICRINDSLVMKYLDTAETKFPPVRIVIEDNTLVSVIDLYNYNTFLININGFLFIFDYNFAYEMEIDLSDIILDENRYILDIIVLPNNDLLIYLMNTDTNNKKTYWFQMTTKNVTLIKVRYILGFLDKFVVYERNGYELESIDEWATTAELNSELKKDWLTCFDQN